MKKTFTPDYIHANSGCYNKEQTEKLSFINRKRIHIKHILDSEISLQDKGWFVANKCGLSVEQKRDLALNCAEIVLPIYQKKYPDDKRVEQCIEGIKKFRKGEITREEIWGLRNAAYAAAAADAAYAAYAAAADAAYAAAAAADAAYAAYAAAADAAYAAYAAAAADAAADADAAAAAAAAAAYAAADADAAAADEYKDKILNALKEVFKT